MKKLHLFTFQLLVYLSCYLENKLISCQRLVIHFEYKICMFFICEVHFMKLSLLSVYITIICSVITFHNTFVLQRDKDDGNCMELHILLITHQMCTLTLIKNGIFCRNQHHHAGFVKTGFFQKTASLQEKNGIFSRIVYNLT